MSPDLLAGASEGVYLFGLCHILARVEIHIEGPHGWAVNLPTWRWGPKWWLSLTNGKELTGYHLWLTLLLIGMFHLPLVFAGWSLALWAKCVSSYMMITAAWDLQWFVWNPAWGFDALRKREVPWFQKKIAGLPVDYFMGYAVSGLLTALIWPPGLALWTGRACTVLLLSALSIPAAKAAQ
ncbi:MAG: hypothetical protein Q7J64_02810 [Elusimicrobiota bacterium]|nr:hypothetical protein [Elusimicrobiota bacterium]